MAVINKIDAILGEEYGGYRLRWSGLGASLSNEQHPIAEVIQSHQLSVFQVHPVHCECDSNPAIPTLMTNVLYLLWEVTISCRRQVIEGKGQFLLNEWAENMKTQRQCSIVAGIIFPSGIAGDGQKHHSRLHEVIIRPLVPILGHVTEHNITQKR